MTVGNMPLIIFIIIIILTLSSSGAAIWRFTARHRHKTPDFRLWPDNGGRRREGTEKWVQHIITAKRSINGGSTASANVALTNTYQTVLSVLLALLRCHSTCNCGQHYHRAIAFRAPSFTKFIQLCYMTVICVQIGIVRG